VAVSFIMLALHAITNHAWVSCFILSTMGTILALENSSLLSEMRREDEEIEVLKILNSDKLLHKMKQLETELSFMVKERVKQKLINLQRTRKLHLASES
jgi:hypothetical protein